MAAIVGVVLLVNWWTQSEPLARQWQTFVGEAMNVNSQTAIQIYENEGVEGLGEYLDRLNSRQRINAVAMFDENRKRIAGSLDLTGREDLLLRALNSDEPEFLRETDKTFAANRGRLSDGRIMLYAIEIKRFQAPPFFTNRLLLQILAVVLTAGLVCYALASYISSPIRKLRDATRTLAGGNLSVRVSPKISNRADDLALLANDFDDMAERIESLINSEKRLTRDISHELRSPLARIKVALELLRAKAPEEAGTLVNRIDSESDRLNELVSQILTLSKLETGSGEFEKNEINLKKLVESLIADAEFEAAAKGSSVRAARLDEVNISGNEHLITRAVDNVLRNAVGYTAENTEVVVSLEAVNGEAVIAIEDNGPGVPSEDLEKLFRPFYRIGEARDRKSGGTGLGLAIAERAVHNHRGNIGAENTGTGLRVTIRIPRKES